MEPLDGVYVHTTGDKRCSGSEGGRGMFVKGVRSQVDERDDVGENEGVWCARAAHGHGGDVD
jgi:hypothetical protein